MWRLLAPVTLIPLLFAPGLVGLMVMLGFQGAVASMVLGAGVIAMFGAALLNSAGTYRARAHIRDMAPWAATVLTLALVLGR